MKTNKTLLALALGTGLFSAATAHAALNLSVDGNTVYDTDLNITWLANPNLAASNTFGVSGIGIGDGRMTWDTAKSWIAGMNAANYLGHNDWRLPTTLQPDASCSTQWFGNSYGSGCTGSEMGHLFYNELGGVAGSSIMVTHNANLNKFQNLHFYQYYWSSTKAVIIPDEFAWSFLMNGGTQHYEQKERYLAAWAVRDGGAPVSAVPEPETYAMLLVGLGLLGFTARRRSRS